MCGLVAMVTKNRNGFTNVNLDMFDIMLFVDQMRGMDSTGVFLVNNVGNVTIAKAAVHSTDFLPKKEYREVRTDAIRNGWAMVGHNRKATKGTINDQNAHPFWVEDKLVLVHNGSYYGDHKHLGDTEVDSEAIAQTLAEAGPDGIEEALQSVNAAYALIWYDVQNKRLNIVRNTQRPLHWMETGDAYYFCSDPDFMEFAAKRCNVTILGDDKGKGPYSFDVSSLETWALNADRSTTLTAETVDIAYRTAARPAQSAANFSPTSPVASWPVVDNETGEPVTEIASAIREAQRIADAQVDWAARNRAREEARRAIITAQHGPVTQVETKAPPKFPVPDWGKQHTFAQWVTTKNAYGTGSRVRVECKNYLSDDAGPGMIYMSGRTMDSHNLYCVFPISRELFDAITSPNSPARAAQKAEFMVDVDVVTWRPSEKVKESVETQPGVITVIGNRAKMYSDGTHSVQ